MMVRRLLHEETAVSVLLWVGFFAFMFAPLMALGIEMGRLAHAKSTVQQAADAAALAGAQEVDWELFRWTGIAALRGSAIGVAQEYALANAEPLTSRGIYPVVDSLFIHSRTFVVAAVNADVSPLFPAWFPAGHVHAWGEAEMRMRKD
jgi:uncharacterized membrane protein